MLRRLLAVWVRFKVRPEEAVEHVRDRDKPACYVLEHDSRTDLAVLENACVRLNLPRPNLSWAGKGSRGARVLGRLQKPWFSQAPVLYLSRPRGFWDERIDRRAPPQLQEMIAALAADPQLDVE